MSCRSRSRCCAAGFLASLVQLAVSRLSASSHTLLLVLEAIARYASPAPPPSAGRRRGRRSTRQLRRWLPRPLLVLVCAGRCRVRLADSHGPETCPVAA